MPIQVGQRGRCGRAGGGRKHLEFPAGGDQRITVTRVGTIKADRHEEHDYYAYFRSYATI